MCCRASLFGGIFVIPMTIRCLHTMDTWTFVTYCMIPDHVNNLVKYWLCWHVHNSVNHTHRGDSSINQWIVLQEATFNKSLACLLRWYLDSFFLKAAFLWRWNHMGCQLTHIAENTGQDLSRDLIHYGERKARDLHCERWANIAVCIQILLYKWFDWLSGGDIQTKFNNASHVVMLV